ncbi:hypothetical protein OH77DRAFT_1430787 [Trametes cingulata]|nr:hypothetical protein OH77DRAFT_1430787 [Trametes cingulata]
MSPDSALDIDRRPPLSTPAFPVQPYQQPEKVRSTKEADVMPVDILVLGATGYTGRLITRYLYNHPQRSSFTFALGVRSISKGESLKNSLGLDDSVQLVQVDVTRYDEIEAAVKDAKVVINSIGPYWLWGTEVVRACALHGKRYVDLCGETHFIRKIIDQYDYLATKTGAIIVPASGFDSIPADITVFLSNRTLKNALGTHVQLGLSQSFYSAHVKPSGGTLASVLSTVEVAPPNKVLEAVKDYALSPIKGAPSPGFRPLVRVPFSSPPQYGTVWFMEPYNRAVVQRTFGLNQVALSAASALFGDKQGKEKEEQVRPLAYGPEFSYAEYYVEEGPGGVFSAIFFTAFMAVYMAALYIGPIRWVIKKFLPAPGEGPSEEELKKGFLKVTNYTATASSPQTWAKTTMTGKADPGYLLTATMISECALGLLLDDADLPPTARAGGILTPATALGDVIVRRIEATGEMHFESEIISANEESRKER